VWGGRKKEKERKNKKERKEKEKRKPALHISKQECRVLKILEHLFPNSSAYNLHMK
jgi:hypothetical protein